jgi:hypothetical protein
MTACTTADGKKRGPERAAHHADVPESSARARPQQDEQEGFEFVVDPEAEEDLEKLIEELEREDPEFEVPDGVWAY